MGPGQASHCLWSCLSLPMLRAVKSVMGTRSSGSAAAELAGASAACMSSSLSEGLPLAICQMFAKYNLQDRRCRTVKQGFDGSRQSTGSGELGVM